MKTLVMVTIPAFIHPVLYSHEPDSMSLLFMFSDPGGFNVDQSFSDGLSDGHGLASDGIPVCSCGIVDDSCCHCFFYGDVPLFSWIVNSCKMLEMKAIF